MKRLFGWVLVIVMTIGFVSCGPSAYTFMMETRQPSACGLDFSGKSISIVFLEDSQDSSLSHNIAESLAEGLEKDYYDGERGINLYKLPYDMNGRYSAKDTLVSLVMALNTDVVILLDKPRILQNSEDGKNIVLNNAYSYDSLQSDTVKVVQTQIRCEELDKSTANSIAEALSSYYAGEWINEAYTLTYYDFWNNRWVDAIEYAIDMEWDKAIEIWMGFLNTNDLEAKSCAEYNIALGCLVSGQPELAKEWLDRSDADRRLSVSAGLRKRIEQKLAK